MRKREGERVWERVWERVRGYERGWDGTREGERAWERVRGYERGRKRERELFYSSQLFLFLQIRLDNLSKSFCPSSWAAADKKVFEVQQSAKPSKLRLNWDETFTLCITRCKLWRPSHATTTSQNVPMSFKLWRLQTNSLRLS